jgi:cysteine desulfurase
LVEISYFDNAATTRTDPRVVEAMLPYFTEVYGNASELHAKGLEARKAMDYARASIALKIGAQPEEIVFTGCGTEADNLAIKGVARRHKKRGKHIIVSPIEHPAVYKPAEYLAKEEGFEVTWTPVDREGFVDPGRIEDAIRKDTILVSVMHGNNEIGTIEPVKEIAAICRERGVLFHTDAVQTLGKVPIDVEDLGVDLLTGSAHKIYGPKGVGMLYVRKGVRPLPVLHGGGHEGGLRSGTENVAGIVGFAKALELCLDDLEGETVRYRKMRDMLIEGVLDATQHSFLNGPAGDRRLPHNAHFGVRYVEGESMMLRLDAEGFEVSTGSACSSADLEPSRTLLAIGLKHEEAHGSVRVTLGRWSKVEDVERLIEVFPGVARQLQEMSPLYAEARARGEV